MLNLDEKGTYSLPSIHLCLYLRPIYASREHLRVSMRNIAFRRNWRKIRGQTKLRKSQRKRTQACTTVHKVAQPCCRAVPKCTGAHAATHGRAPRCTVGRVLWHGRAPACVAGFEQFCSDSFIIFSFIVFLSRENTLERDFRVSLESCYLCFWNWIHKDWRLFDFNSAVDSSLSLSSLLFDICF